MHTRYLSILSGLLLLKALILSYVILHAGIGLGPDEAQYWTWSQDLDWGYYSKPPGIAWEIALGTWLFGNTEFGVRSIPLLIGTLIPFAVYFMAKRCNLKPASCFAAAVSLAFCPIGILASFLAITDGGMILFWTIACAYFAGKIEKKETPDYLLIGVCIFFGALFKWPIYSLWVAILASWIFFPFLRTPRILIGMVVSLAALLPSVYWNATHEWATFRHVLATLIGGHAKPKEGALLSGNILEFVGAQAILVSPILFVLLVLAWKQLFRRSAPMSDGVKFCGWLSFAGVALGIVMSIFMKMQGNWAIFAYPTAFVLLGWYVIEGPSRKVKWLAAGIVLSVAAIAAVFSIPAVQSQNKLQSLSVPYKISPFRHNVGWDKLSDALKAAGYNEHEDYLFGDKYQTASILSFYGPDQKRAYFFNLQGSRKNQFSFWPGIDQEQRKRGFFAVVENIPQLDDPDLPGRYSHMLESYFTKVKYLGIQPLFEANGRTVKGVLLFETEGNTGKVPVETDLY